ncbi:MAG: HEPN domain-containing protein [Chitinivibrionales bacterium]
MKEKLGDLVQHLLTRARESFEEAKILADSGHWNTCVSRLYYSCFYSASALLQKHGLSSSKHSGVRSLFNNRFARTGIVTKDVSAIYNDLFDRRQESDYGPFFEFEETDVKPWFTEVAKFIDATAKLANQIEK